MNHCIIDIVVALYMLNYQGVTKWDVINLQFLSSMINVFVIVEIVTTLDQTNGQPIPTVKILIQSHEIEFVD